MSEQTTIDTLQIEIQTSSTTAASGIKDLATALGELKKNGKVTTAINNLGTLSEKLRGFADASNVSRSIGKVTGALKTLKDVGSVTNIASGVKKLGEALDVMNSANIDGVAPKIERIATALQPLSAVKAGGIGTMVNGLMKLGKVTESLDEATIDAFADKIKRLTAVLEPLSTKMTTIQNGLRGVNSKARSAGSSVKKMGEDVNTTTLNFSTFVHSIQTVVQWLSQAIQKFAEFMSQAIEWDGIAARFGRGFGDQAGETYEWIQRLNEEMGINVQQFMQYSSIYATMLTGFGVAMEDATKMALGYTELTYDIWAGYNDVYKTFGEAADAVKSAIAGEVEPIRRAGFTIVESTLEQTAANHGLSISLEKATEAQKSYLRYLTLIDQAHSQSLVGTYAKELNTAEGLMRTFSQQVKSLTQAFGSLFLPILVKVMPYLQAFVELLTDGVRALAAFFGITIQGVDWSGYEDGLGGVAGGADDLAGSVGNATEAIKELKNAAIGIDELNVISPTAANAGGAGGAGGGGFGDLDVDSLWDQTIFDSVNQQVDELKDKIKNWLIDIAPIAAGIGTTLAGWKLTNLVEDLKWATPHLTNLAKGITVSGIALVVGKLVWDFTGAYLEGGDETELLKAFGSTALGASLAYFLAGAGKAGVAGAGLTIAVSGVVTLTKLGIEIADGAVDFGDPETWATALLGGLETAVGGVLTWKVVGPWLAKAWSTIAPQAAKLLAGKGGWIGAIVAAVILLIDFLVQNWDKVKQAVGEWWDENMSPMLDEITSAWAELEKAAEPLVPLFRELRELWDSIDWSWLDKVLEFLGGVIFALATAPIAQVLLDIASLIKNTLKIFTGITNIVTGVYDFIVALFNGGDIEAAWQKIWDGVVDVFGGIWGLLSDPIVNLYKGIVKWFTKLWDVLVGHSIVPDTVNAIVEWFTSLPRKIFGPVENFVNGLIEKFKGLWNGLVSWWNGKTPLKTYTPAIGDIKSKLSSAWTSAKNWWNGKSTMSTYTPNIGSISNKVSSAWSSARTWWNTKKSAMSTYTPSIGSIKDRVSSAWTTARNWWGKKSTMSTYTPSIGSIKDKLVSAWNTAKNWWNSNVKLSIPSLSFKVTYSNSGLNAVQKAIVNALGLDGWPKLSFAANGGIFDQGSLIWAGERGAEVVANAGGGRTGVMNVQQMSDAVYEGVYAAVLAAMRAGGGSGGNQAVNVYVDGRQVTAAVEQRQRERGASIMGSQIYSY